MTEEGMQKVLSMISSPGWMEVVKPGLEGYKRAALAQILNPSDNTPAQSNFTKGQLNVLNWLLGWEQRIEHAVKELAEASHLVNPHEEGIGTIYAPQSGEDNPAPKE